MHVGTAQNSTYLAEPHALSRTPHTDHVAKLVTGMPDAEVPPVDRKTQTGSHPDVDLKLENKSRPTLLM